MRVPLFGEERYEIQKVKTGMHGWMQVGWKVQV